MNLKASRPTGRNIFQIFLLGYETLIIINCSVVKFGDLRCVGMGDGLFQ